jgi:predicted methyltransferase
VRSALLLGALSAALVAAPGRQQAPPAPAPATAPAVPPPLPPPLHEYLGRKIAPTMSFQAEQWLVRAEREKEERCGELLKALHLKSDQVVADIGCGNGFYTFRLADLVGPKGRVYAVDIQPEMLELLKSEAKRRKTGENVTPVLGTVVDPKLPPASVDLAFLVDVYHEFDHPVEMLAALKKSLKPGGRLVLVEFRLEDPEVPIKLLHRMSKAQMKKEMDANGFDVAEEFDGLPWQHVVFYAPRPEPEAAKDAAKEPGKRDTKKDGRGDQPPSRDQ